MALAAMLHVGSLAGSHPHSLLQVNGQALSKAFSPQTKPWITLARALGTVLCTVGKQVQGSMQVCTLGEPGWGDHNGQAGEQVDGKVNR